MGLLGDVYMLLTRMFWCILPQSACAHAATSASRGVPHAPPITFQPIPIQYCSSSRQRSSQQTPVLQGRRQSLMDSHRIPSMQLPTLSDDDEHSSAMPDRLAGQEMPQSSTLCQSAALKQTTMKQYTGHRHGPACPQTQSQPQSQTAYSPSPSHTVGSKQALSSASSLHSTQSFYVAESNIDTRQMHRSQTNSLPVQQNAPFSEGATNPCSNGRSVVISGFKKGMPGFEAKERALAACKPHGTVHDSWVRKGRTGCWFVVAQFDEVTLTVLIACSFEPCDVCVEKCSHSIGSSKQAIMKPLSTPSTL